MNCMMEPILEKEGIDDYNDENVQNQDRAIFWVGDINYVCNKY